VRRLQYKYFIVLYDPIWNAFDKIPKNPILGYHDVKCTVVFDFEVEACLKADFLRLHLALS